MGYNSVRTDPIEKLFSRQERLQNILLLSSIILCLIALANFSICIWIRYVKTKMGQIEKKELTVCHIFKAYQKILQFADKNTLYNAHL